MADFPPSHAIFLSAEGEDNEGGGDKVSVGRTVFNTSTATNNDLAAATFVILTFTTQKNGVRGEKLAMGPQGTPYYATRRPCAGA